MREAQLYGAAPLALHMTHVKGAGIDFSRNNLLTMGACTDKFWCMDKPNVTAAALKVLTLYLLWLYLLCPPQRSRSTRYLHATHLSIHPSLHLPNYLPNHPFTGLHAASPPAVGGA